MKRLAYFPLLLTLLSACKQPTVLNSKDKAKDSVATKMPAAPTDCDTVNWYKDPKDRDSVLVYESDGIKGYYTKGELKRMLRSYPELDDPDFPLHPDFAYSKRGMDGKMAPCESHCWGCEACQDEYFILYAHFLQRRNGVEKYKQERKKLIELYRDINSIFGRLAGGGTYFGHQYKRILGYAEYAIYSKKWDTENDYYNKQYDISKQKKLYISALKQEIADEIDNNVEIDRDKKPALKNELFETVNHTDRLINSYFYLKMTQEFQHSHY